MIRAAAPRGLITRIGATPADADTYDDDRDIDWIAVERAANSDYNPVLLNEEELREVALLLAKTGMRERAISTRINIYERRIGEWLAEAGLLPPERICSQTDCGRLMVGRRLCINHLQTFRKQQKQAREAAQNTQNLEAAA